MLKANFNKSLFNHTVLCGNISNVWKFAFDLDPDLL